MSKQDKKKSNQGSDKPGKGRQPLVAVLIGIAVVVVAAVWWTRPLQVDPPAAQGTPASPASTNSPAANTGFQKLVGRWLRPDGGYIVQVKSVEDDGNMDAGYFNPNPIHVAQAKASRVGSSVKVYIELRDVNYPGSNYTLVYDPVADQLKGIYFQAIERQNFEVFFVRQK